MIQEPPDNERWVLTWVRDSAKLECWQIDSYNQPSKWSGPGFWGEAKAWGQTVLFWREIPPPTKEELEG